MNDIYIRGNIYSSTQSGLGAKSGLDKLDHPTLTSSTTRNLRKKQPLMSAGLHPIIMHDLACSNVAEEHRRADRKREGRALTRRARRAR
jgi:hypothetical protein